MPVSEYLFTSESVSEGHPDKVCDLVSDSIVDTFLAEDSVQLALEEFFGIVQVFLHIGTGFVNGFKAFIQFGDNAFLLINGWVENFHFL